MNLILKIWWKVIALLVLAIILIAVIVLDTQFRNQQIESQKVQQFKLQELHAKVGDIQKLVHTQEAYNDSTQTLLKNFSVTKQSHLAWLRLELEQAGLEFVNFKKLQDTKVQLEVRGSEKSFWSFVENTRIRMPWLRLQSANLSQNKKGFQISQFQVDWPAGDFEKFSKDIGILDSAQSLVTKSIFTNHKFHPDKPKYTNSTAKTVKASTPWPANWSITGNMPSRGVYLKSSGSAHFWKKGTSFQEWELKEVYSNYAEFTDPGGVSVSVKW